MLAYSINNELCYARRYETKLTNILSEVSCTEAGQFSLSRLVTHTMLLRIRSRLFHSLAWLYPFVAGRLSMRGYKRPVRIISLIISIR